MPDFDVRVTKGVVLRDWTDPIGPEGQPSRLNPRHGFPHRFRVAMIHHQVRLEMEVGGVLGRPDSELDGRLFHAWCFEAPGSAGDVDLNMPRRIPASGLAVLGRPPGGVKLFKYLPHTHSTIWIFQPDLPGHHTFAFHRPHGGAVHVHIDVEEPLTADPPDP